MWHLPAQTQFSDNSFSQRSAVPVLCFSGPGWPASHFS
ncbi:MAG: hypothetical protein QOF09_1240, partial [Alphaproteobacteria bacterium]|nr:hypothetical protein [Alphaproteobacteria bacterium]